MLLSKACEYGIRAVLYLTDAHAEGYVPVRAISETLSIPHHFLAKIIQTLTQAEVLTSHRGPTGGVALSRPASEITLEEVVVAIDGDALFTECVLGLPGCGHEKPCPLHTQWATARDRVHRLFQNVTLAAMSDRMEDGDYRLRSLTDDA
ncbi:MAG: Rrf2 family transcriptional regulator [Rubricoccaceae bacterium]